MQDKHLTIALYGGSFDPPHIGHEAVVQALLTLKEIDKIVIMPTFLNPFKKVSFAPANLRLQWLKTLFLESKRVFISAFEVEQKRKVSTYESVQHLHKKYKKIYIVIGADNLESLHRWHNIELLKKMVTFIVASRDEIDIPEEFLKLHTDIAISSSKLRNDLDMALLPKSIAESIVTYYKENNER